MMCIVLPPALNVPMEDDVLMRPCCACPVFVLAKTLGTHTLPNAYRAPQPIPDAAARLTAHSLRTYVRSPRWAEQPGNAFASPQVSPPLHISDLCSLYQCLPLGLSCFKHFLMPDLVGK